MSATRSTKCGSCREELTLFSAVGKVEAKLSETDLDQAQRFR